jgi:sugar/nucleoside kinase (ribokinase family)
MSILVVGSVALDDVETPFGKRTSALGGAAVYFGLAASYFTDVQIVGVVGTDFPQQHLDLLADRGIDLRGLQVRDGATFRWGGQYGYDLNARETAFTDLNVFAEFNPAIPEEYRQTEHVFLANIAPSLQLNVLDQMTAPQSAALDTMDFWIEGTPDELRRVLERVDIVLINDSETRELAQEPNIRTAANAILDWGFAKDWLFAVPGLPLETIVDPTGAGDSFAGGFLGYLAATGEITPEGIRRAAIYGSAMGSFCCEAFSVDRLAHLEPTEIDTRFREFEHLTRFDYEPILQDV